MSSNGNDINDNSKTLKTLKINFKENPTLVGERKLIDAEPREIYIIGCLLLPIIGIGIYPRLITESYLASVNNLVDRNLNVVKNNVKSVEFVVDNNEILKAPSL